MIGLKEKKSQIIVAVVANIIGVVWGTTMGEFRVHKFEAKL
jgi:hypothetical protein